MSHCPLLELPNELILHISQDLEDDTLLHLAVTRKGMNLLLLPGILTRFDSELPSSFERSLPSLSITAESLKLLSEIGIASFVHSEEILTLPLPSDSALTTLNIHSSLLFHATFYPWTLRTLNTSLLLTLPSFARLVIRKCVVAVPDLARFVARHTTPEALDLSFVLYFLQQGWRAGYPNLRTGHSIERSRGVEV
ncbi:hypothetical protein B0H19DRAFT_1255172 [Mycena capillaripes]|nr:hypothetical protein B0H19DRAFT_1255172 [Mycena capillaripes]